jgi:predicted HTH transcriptional regulator
MEDFPDVTGLKIFPMMESHTLELKLGVSPVIKTKCIPTFCAFLNSKGGYIVFGVEDKERKIVGIEANSQELNNELLWFDNFYHIKRITDIDGNYLEPGNLEARVVEVRPSVRIIVVTVRPTPGKTYKCQDGSVWYRLSASIFRIRETSPEKEMNKIMKRLTEEKKRRQEISLELYCVKEEMKTLLGSAKEVDKQMDILTEAVYKNILEKKTFVEREISKRDSYYDIIICGISLCALTSGLLKIL